MTIEVVSTPAIDITVNDGNQVVDLSITQQSILLELANAQGPAGPQGVAGSQGDDGRGIVSVVRTSGTGAAGTTDTYTITYTDNTTSTFQVYNGADGSGAGDMTKAVYDTNNDGKVNAANTADTATTASSVPWSGITDKPSTFTPSAHTHIISDVTNLQTSLDAKINASSGTASGLTLNDGYTEEVFAVSGTTPALSPANGSIQTWALTASSTPTSGTWNSGQSITLLIDDGSAYTITWSSLNVTWKTNTGTAPALNTTGYTVVVLWKVGTTVYGARVGDA